MRTRLRTQSLLCVLFTGCVSRNIPPEEFACGFRETCDEDITRRDAANTTEAGARADAEPLEVGLDVRSTEEDEPDSGALDASVRDAGVRDAGMVTLCDDPDMLLRVPKIIGTTESANNSVMPCSNAGAGNDFLFRLEVPSELERLDVSTYLSNFDTVLAMADGRCVPFVCNDDANVHTIAAGFALTNVPIGPYTLVLDGFDAPDKGSFMLTVNGVIREGSPCDPSDLLYTCGSRFCLGSEGSRACTRPLDCADGIDLNGNGATDENAALCQSPPVVACPASESIIRGTTRTLRATASDPVGIAWRRWTVVSSPFPAGDSHLELPDNTDEFTRTFDVPGTWVFRFASADEDANGVACETTIDVVSGGILQVVVISDDPFDHGLDVGAHLLDPEATRWFDPRHDCSPENCTSGLAWGAPGTADDPMYVSSPRVELITVPSPAPSATYRVGVHPRLPVGVDFVSVTVLVLCDGVARGAFGPYTLVTESAPGADNASFWKVADIRIDPTGQDCTTTHLVTPQGYNVWLPVAMARVSR